MGAGERRDDSVIVGLLTTLQSEVSAMRNELSTHIAEEPNDIARAIQSALNDAFPEGKPGPHKDFHQSIIDRNKWLAEVFKEVAKHIAKYGLFAFLLWMFWHGVQDLVNHVIHPK